MTDSVSSLPEPREPQNANARAMVRRFAGWRCTALHGNAVVNPCESCHEMAIQGFALAVAVERESLLERVQALEAALRRIKSAESWTRAYDIAARSLGGEQTP